MFPPIQKGTQIYEFGESITHVCTFFKQKSCYCSYGLLIYKEVFGKSSILASENGYIYLRRCI